MRAHDAFDRIRQVFRLQVSELALLAADLQIKKVVIDLRNQRFQRNTAFRAGWRLRGWHNVARVHKRLRRSWRGDGSLFEETRRMPGCRHLLDALSECSAAAHDVGDFSLVAVNFNRTRPKEVSGRVQV